MGRKPKAGRDKGRPVRLSNEVLGVLTKKLQKGESYDSLLRRILSLPSRSGKTQLLANFWVLPGTLSTKRTLAEARGQAVIEAVRNGKRKTEKPIRVIEYV